MREEGKGESEEIAIQAEKGKGGEACAGEPESEKCSEINTPLKREMLRVRYWDPCTSPPTASIHPSCYSDPSFL